MSKPVYIINIIGGPGCGKTTICALLFAGLKIRGHLIEYCPEIQKSMVWLRQFDKLNNQYLVSSKMINILKKLTSIGVEMVITDGCILHGVHYNRHNPYNTSNVEKTEKLILDEYKKFNNINIFLDRGSFRYEKEGRIQTEEESLGIDRSLLRILDDLSIPYKRYPSDVRYIEPMLEYILSECR